VIASDDAIRHRLRMKVHVISDNAAQDDSEMADAGQRMVITRTGEGRIVARAAGGWARSVRVREHATGARAAGVQSGCTQATQE
jgi:hypothetical protein